MGKYTDLENKIYEMDREMKDLKKILLTKEVYLEEDPWIYSPDITMVKGENAPVLKIYPSATKYSDKCIYISKDGGYYSKCFELAGVSLSTKAPYKYKISSKNYIWCGSFRIKESVLQKYFIECIDYMSDRLI